MILEILLAYTAAALTFAAVWGGIADYNRRIDTYGFCGICGHLIAPGPLQLIEGRCRCENPVVRFEGDAVIYVPDVVPDLEPDVERERVAA